MWSIDINRTLLLTQDEQHGSQPQAAAFDGAHFGARKSPFCAVICPTRDGIWPIGSCQRPPKTRDESMGHLRTPPLDSVAL